MSDEISIALTWFANYANFYSILSVLLCFFVMVVFILRLNSENFLSSSATHFPVVQEQSMVSLLNPFSVQLVTSRCSSLKDGLYLTVSMKKRSNLKVMWGVDICSFQKELQLTSSEINERFNNDRIFEEKFKHCEDFGILTENDGDREVYFKSPSELNVELLGEPPRMLYPAVVVCMLETCDVSPHSTAIVAQFTVIHLKDSVCSLDSHIVYQFVKTSTNKLLGLQPIFMSSSETDKQKGSDPNSANKNSSPRNSSNGGSQVSVEETDKGQGDISSESSEVRQHCESCGKIRHVENIPPTRQHQLCNCTEDDLEGKEIERSEVKVTGQETCEQNKEVEQNLNNIGQGSDYGNTSAMNTDYIEDLEPELNQLEPCCVCQSSEIFYSLLPCRHACVCSTCVKLLDKCPICRSHIEAYFRLHNRFSEQELRENMEQAAAGPRLNRWQAFNQRLNDMFGFV